MESSKFQSSKFGKFVSGKIERSRFCCSAVCSSHSPFTVSAHEGEDHSADKKTETKTAAAATGAKITSVTAERNMQTEAGQFNVHSDAHAVRSAHGRNGAVCRPSRRKSRGRFRRRRTRSARKRECYGKHYDGERAEASPKISRPNTKAAMLTALLTLFENAGDYKIVFNVATGDDRSFSTDFPVSVVARR